MYVMHRHTRAPSSRAPGPRVRDAPAAGTTSYVEYGKYAAVPVALLTSEHACGLVAATRCWRP